MSKLEPNSHHIVPRFPDGKCHAFTMSYDDSVTSDIRLAEIMRQNGVRGTFNVITGRLAAPGTERTYPDGEWGYMTEKQCVETYGDDMEAAVHTRDHFFLTRLPSSRIAEQILADRKALELAFKKPIRGLAYPYAAYNDEVVSVLKTCGICYARTVIGDENFSVPTDWLRMHTTCHHNNSRLFELADRFFTPPGRYGQPKLFYLWGHSYEFEQDGNWNIIEDFLKRMGGHGEVWYATNIEIYDYMRAYDRLEWTLDGTTVHNPSALDVWIEKWYPDNAEYNHIIHIPSGKTVTVK